MVHKDSILNVLMALRFRVSIGETGGTLGDIDRITSVSRPTVHAVLSELDDVSLYEINRDENGELVEVDYRVRIIDYSKYLGQWRYEIEPTKHGYDPVVNYAYVTCTFDKFLREYEIYEHELQLKIANHFRGAK